MGIITLTSDIGTKDSYVGSVKGAIAKQNIDIKVIDISHDVSPFNHYEAAFMVKNSYKDFPEGTVHIIGVDSESRIDDNLGDVKHLVVYYDKHFFIGADNGIFSLIIENKEDLEIYSLDHLAQAVPSSPFVMRDLFTMAACHIINGGTLPVLGAKQNGVNRVLNYEPQVTEHGITANIMHIDRYGNCITNLSKSVFEEVRKGRRFTCFIRNTDYGINTIHSNYSDGADNDIIALYTNTGYVEIAVCRGANEAGGGAASLFGLKLFSQLRFEFEKSPQNLSELE